LGPPIVNEAGFVDPLRSPVQFEKLYPALAVAETDTVCPLLYQLTPEGLTVPPPDGLTEVVKLYCVVKFAVYVVLVEGTVTE
jgi:hypothetical protein